MENDKKLVENKYRNKPKNYKRWQFIASFIALMIDSLVFDRFFPEFWPFWTSGKNLLIFLCSSAITMILLIIADKVVDYFYFRNSK